MNHDDSQQTGETVETENFAQRREFVRRSVLRANRAVGLILGVVVLLGLVLVILGQRARESQRRAEQAEQEATDRLWKASLEQARAQNLSTKAGHRESALDAVRSAAKIRPSVELRNEAIAALSQRDLVQEREWTLQPRAYGTVFDPELKYYVERYQDRVLSLFRVEDNSLVHDFPMPFFYPKTANVGDYVFSSTGKYLVIRYNGGGLTLWDPLKAQMLRVLNLDPRAAQFSWPPSFSADDRLMGLSMKGSAGFQMVYDLEKGEVRPLESAPGKLAYRGGFNFVRISPRGDLIAAWDTNMIYVFDAVTGELRYSVQGQSTIEAIAWDYQGQRLSFSCDDWSVSIWEPSGGQMMQLNGKAHRPWFQEFSRDGNLLVTSGIDGMTRLWDAVSGRLVCEQSGLLAGRVSPDGQRIAGGRHRQTSGIWRVEQPVALKLFRGAWANRATAWMMDLTSDGRRGVWSPPWWVGQNGYEVFDFEKGTSIVRANKDRLFAGFRPGHDQLWTTSGGALKFYDLPPDGTVPETAALTMALPKGINGIIASFNADGRYVALSGPQRALAVMDLNAPTAPPVTLERAFTSADSSLPGPASTTGGGPLAMSPDGRWVAAGMNVDGGHPAIWDAHSGKIVQRLDCALGYVTFSPDGRYLTVVSSTRLLCFATEGWKLLWERERDLQQSYCGIAAFNGDGSLLACSMGSARVVFYTLQGDAVAEWNFRDLLFVANLRFAADGSRLFAGGLEGRIASVDMTALRQGLSALQLDWPLRASTTPAETANSSTNAWAPALLGLISVGVAAVLGALVLRRQRRLTGEFVETTELAARRTQELAAEKEVSELKSRFVTTVSHEFRTPLGITMSAIELLRHYEDRLPSTEKAQLFEDIHSATKNMAGLMEQVLLLGRVDAGKLAYKPLPVDIDVLARKLTDESLSATNRKCPIAWQAENDLTGAHADEALLRHILTNLLSNAVKYSPAEAPVHFRARREGLMAVFTVQDSGIGIPEKDLPQLFEAFHRASNVGEIPGTGLGLVLSKRCAELHNGSIQVKSTQGQGTTFTVRIPAWG